MATAPEKTDKSPRRKLVKFFERSRDQWKAKARAAKKGSKRLGKRGRFLERRKAASQQQVHALAEQLAEWQAKQGQSARELEELKKKYRLTGPSR